MNIGRDLRFAVRQLRNHRGTTLLVTLTLALGIGANTAIYTLLDRALLGALGVHEPERLLRIVTDRADAGVNHNLSYPLYRSYIESTEAFRGILARSPIDVSLTRERATELVPGSLVTTNYFDVLGIRPAIGRGFLPADEAERAAVAVISHELWRRRFDGDPQAVGQVVTLNRQPFTIIGVGPEGFTGLERGGTIDVWVPAVLYDRFVAAGGDTDWLETPGISWLDVVGRLADGRDARDAEAALELLDPRLHAEGLIADGERTALLPGNRGFDRQVSSMELPLKVLMAAAGLVLLLACINIANLLLARAIARGREIAIRLSLGAGRRNIVRQLLTESLVLSVLGGAAGVIAALWTMDLVLSFAPLEGGRLALDTGVDVRMLAFALGLSVLTGVVFGLVPALRATRPDLVRHLKTDPRAGGRSDRDGGFRTALVVSQVALSLILLIGAGLFLRTLRNLQDVNLGFDARDVVLASIDLESGGYSPEEGRTFYRELLDRLSGSPGVASVSMASTVIPNPGGSNWSGLPLEGYTPAPDEDVSFDVNVVGPRYFETLNASLLRGRPFDVRDDADAPRVAIVNETMARRYWDGDAIGRHIYVGADTTAPAIRIIGVARDGKYRSLRETPRANVYFPVQQVYRGSMTLLVRGPDAAALAPTVRRIVRELDPELPVFGIRTLEQHVARVLSQERMVATLTSLFAVLALLVASLGIYGVTSYFVGQRTREIGVRMALGATWRHIVRSVLGRGLGLIIAGFAIGVVVVGLLARTISSLLYEVEPADPLSVAAATLALLLAGLAALYLPARRAAAVDPMLSLKDE